MNLDHDFVQVSKVSGDPKKGLPKSGTLYPQIQVKTKKKVFTKNETTFFPEFKCTHTLRRTPESNYWGRCRCRPNSNYWGGYSQIIGGDISPHPPWVSAPLLMYNYLRTSALNNQIDFVNKMLTKMRQGIFFIYKKKKNRKHFFICMIKVK